MNLLPKDIKFHHYYLDFTPNLDTFQFKGSAKIQLEVLNNTLKLALHAKNLDIESCILKFPNNTDMKPIKTSYNPKTTTVTFIFYDNIPLGKSYAYINFHGVLNDNMKGFYRSKYIDKSGNYHVSAVTQFEPGDARMAFPCGDEPLLKARFTITMNVPRNKTCLTNTSIKSRTRHQTNDNLDTVVFKTTPYMSTYLVAMYVGDSSYVENIIKKPHNQKELKLRVYTPINRENEGKFALEVATKAMEYYEKYFGIDYPLDKLDMIAIPDFSAGAMENWGLVTYRSKYILYDPLVNSNSIKRIIAQVVCHELAHQWFGNLVTMNWWNDLWLNEGFATWMEYNVTNILYPEFNMLEKFINSGYQSALSLDELENSHPIEATVNTVEEVEEIFDEISYSKGACIINMLVGYMGNEKFRQGISFYLTKYMFGNATTEELWKSLEQSSGMEIVELIDSWTKKQGYPIIELTIDPNYIIFTKNRYLASGPNNDNNNDWQVPLNIILKDNVKHNIIMKKSSLKLKISELINLDSNEWIKLNNELTGLYRTKYDPILLERLKNPIITKQLNHINRYDIIMNLFSFGQSGYDSVVNALEFMDSYKQEDNLLVLTEIVYGMRCVMKICFRNKVIWNYLRQMLIELLEPLIEKYGYVKKSSDTINDHELRCLVIGTTGLLGNHTVVQQAISYINNKNIDPDLRKYFLAMYIRYGTLKEYNKLIEMYENSNTDEERNDILYALGKAKDFTIIIKALNFTLNSGKVRKQDMHSIFVSASKNMYVGKLLWSYIKNNWDNVLNKISNNASLFGTILLFSISSINNQSDLNEANGFLDNYKNDDRITNIKSKINQANEKTQQRINWFVRDFDNIKSWVQKKISTTNYKKKVEKLNSLGCY